MPCAVCYRDCGPLPPIPDWLAPWRDQSERACSLVCLAALSLRDGKMIDPTENETAALEAAGERAGEYLESLGKSDLAAMSGEEWRTLIEVIVTGFTDRLRELADARPPH